MLPNFLALTVWFALSLAIIRLQITTPLPGITAYIIAFAIAYYMLAKRDRHSKISKPEPAPAPSDQSANWKLIVLRACAGGTVIGATLPQGSIFFLLYILYAHYLFPLGILPGTLLSEALVLLAIYLTIRWQKIKHRYKK